MFIFGLPTLVNHNERTRELGLLEIQVARKGPRRLHETSDKYTCFQKIVLLFKRIKVIPEDYNQQNRSLYLRKLQLANNHSRKKPQEREKGSRKKKKKKRGEERNNIRSGT